MSTSGPYRKVHLLFLPTDRRTDTVEIILDSIDKGNPVSMMVQPEDYVPDNFMEHIPYSCSNVYI
jgi:hypothetical protein